MRTKWKVLSLTLAGPALGGPGFDGVGDRGRIPAFSDEEAALEDEEALLEIVAKHDPEQHERLLRLREVDRPAYLLALSRVAKVVERAKDDPEFRERRLSIQSKTQQVKELAREHRRLPAAWISSSRTGAPASTSSAPGSSSCRPSSTSARAIGSGASTSMWTSC